MPERTLQTIDLIYLWCAGLVLKATAPISVLLGAVIGTLVRRPASPHESAVTAAMSVLVGGSATFAAYEHWSLGPGAASFLGVVFTLAAAPVGYGWIRLWNRVERRSDGLGDALADRVEDRLK